MEWQILDTGVASAAQNMALDQQLLDHLSSIHHAILHFYEWEKDSATYGYFIDPFAYLDERAVQRHSLDLARRSTGGGIIFHLTDLAFSLLVPATHAAFSVNTLQNYAFVNRLVIQAIERFSAGQIKAELLAVEPGAVDDPSAHFCMAKPTQYDVMVGGRKVGGAAQRRTKHGFLHQGTISLAMPPENFLMEVLQPKTSVLEAMQQNTFCLLPGSPTPKQIKEARKEMRALLSNGFLLS